MSFTQTPSDSGAEISFAREAGSGRAQGAGPARWAGATPRRERAARDRAHGREEALTSTGLARSPWELLPQPAGVGRAGGGRPGHTPLRRSYETHDARGRLRRVPATAWRLSPSWFSFPSGSG